MGACFCTETVDDSSPRNTAASLATLYWRCTRNGWSSTSSSSSSAFPHETHLVELSWEAGSGFLRGRPRTRFIARSGGMLVAFAESPNEVGWSGSVLLWSELSCLLVIPWLAYTLLLLYSFPRRDVRGGFLRCQVMDLPFLHDERNICTAASGFPSGRAPEYLEAIA